MRVYFVDDDKFFLDVMSRILRDSDFDVVSYLSAKDLLNDLNSESRGCVLADLDMPNMDGMALHQELLRSSHPLPIVFLTGSGNIPVSVQAMRLGAEDFIIKGAPKDDLIAAINGAFARFKKEQAIREQQSAVTKKLTLLTDREREVLKHVVQGKLNKQIADDLGIHERTVKFHRTAITTKLNMPSVAELTKFWLEAGFSTEN